MTKRAFFLLLLLVAAAWSHKAIAQCTSNAGTLGNQGDYTRCINNGDGIQFGHTGFVLDADDIKRYVMHDGTPTQIGNIVANQVGSFFFYDPNMMPDVTYQIAALVGNPDPNNANMVDLSDPCLSIAGGISITYLSGPTIESTVSGSLTCGGGSVTLSAEASPTGPAYTYQWFGGGLVFVQQNITVSQPGFYYVVATDPVSGCRSNYDTLQVVNDNTFPTVNITVSNPNCDGVQYTANTNNPNNTYAWSNGWSSATILADQPGTYCVTVTSPQGCTATACRTYNVSSVPLSVEIVSIGNNICNDSLGMFAQAAGGVVPYTYLWNTGYAWSWLEPETAGEYSVTVTDANGCTAVASFVQEQDEDDCATLAGVIFADFAEDCTFDAGDQGLQGFTILIEGLAGTTYYAYSDPDGNYGFELPGDTYTITPLLNGSPWTPCAPSYTVTIAAGTTVTQNIPLQPDELCPMLTIDFASGILRRCNSNNYYWVVYNNIGTAVAEDAYVEVQLDPLMTIVNASITYIDLGNNLYRFDLGDVPFNTSGVFNIQIELSCDAVLGQTFCTEAAIFPNEPCEDPNALWSGASVELSAECTGTEVLFRAKNIGTADMVSQLDYVIIEDAVLLQMPLGAPLYQGEERLVFTAPANGATWRIEAEQEPYHPGLSMPSLSVEGCAAGQTFTLGYVNNFPQDDADLWVDIDCSEVVGSWDPNDKRGFPTGYGAQQYIAPGVDLEYVIRFQNTGTDTAFLVVIRDTLSAALDPGSVVPGASSHPYKFDYYGDGYLKFVFDPIALPDSHVNVAGSQGFVSFRVSQRADIALETDIYNEAAIYFDYNKPVITNRTHHRVGENFVTVGAWTPVEPGLDLLISPNPAYDYATLQLRGLDAEWQIEVVSLTGQTVLRQTAHQSQWRLERGQLPSGTYLIRVSSQGRPLGTAKLMLK